jgi:phosphate transport system substrate-binding protein
MRFTTFLMPVIAGTLLVLPAQARDYVSLAGSSTVLPFATIIAEAMGKNPSFKTPVVVSGGSSVGKKGVCEGIGTEFIDFGKVHWALLSNAKIEKRCK